MASFSNCKAAITAGKSVFHGPCPAQQCAPPWWNPAQCCALLVLCCSALGRAVLHAHPSPCILLIESRALMSGGWWVQLIVTKANQRSSTIGVSSEPWLHYHPRRGMRRSEVEDDGGLVRASRLKCLSSDNDIASLRRTSETWVKNIAGHDLAGLSRCMEMCVQQPIQRRVITDTMAMLPTSATRARTHTCTYTRTTAQTHARPHERTPT